MNKQITEDFVSYEIAKLLKEKGFDEICSYEWGVPDIDKGYVLQKWVINNGQIRNSDLIDGAYAAPSQSLALKWLREVYNIFIEINVSIDLNGAYHYAYSILDKECKYIKRFVGYYSTHKLCVEAALDYVLKNLI